MPNFRSLAKESPKSAKAGGAGTSRQFGGRSCGVKAIRETLSGISEATTTKSFGGSLAEMCTKYSTIASDKCSAV